MNVECGGNDIVFFSCFACPKMTRTIGVGIYIYTLFTYVYVTYKMSYVHSCVEHAVCSTVCAYQFHSGVTL